MAERIWLAFGVALVLFACAALADVAGVWDDFICRPDVVDSMKDGSCHSTVIDADGHSPSEGA